MILAFSYADVYADDAKKKSQSVVREMQSSKLFVTF